MGSRIGSNKVFHSKVLLDGCGHTNFARGVQTDSVRLRGSFARTRTVDCILMHVACVCREGDADSAPARVTGCGRDIALLRCFCFPTDVPQTPSQPVFSRRLWAVHQIANRPVLLIPWHWHCELTDLFAFRI